MLSNQDHGSSELERLQALARAKKAARVINVLGCVIAVWAFKPVPYEAAMITIILMVLVPLPILFRFRGLIHVNEEKASPYRICNDGIFDTGPRGDAAVD